MDRGRSNALEIVVERAVLALPDAQELTSGELNPEIVFGTHAVKRLKEHVRSSIARDENWRDL
jgi:hypothetical protein